MDFYISQSIHYKYFGLKIILTASLPIGDFDTSTPPKIEEPHRLYKTNKGFRVFYINRYKPDLYWMLDKILEDGADASYVKVCKKTGMYVARLDPKQIKRSGEYAVCKFLFQDGIGKSEWKEFIQVHDEWTKAYSNYELL